MADRPILFSAPMVRALLEGRKTQTRRILKPQPDDLREGEIPRALRVSSGDRLWVRETLACCIDWGLFYDAHGGIGPSEEHFLRDDRAEAIVQRYSRDDETIWNVPSIFMPRWASRITLIVEDVKVERLLDISEDDAIAEGITPAIDQPGWWISSTDSSKRCPTPRDAYGDLWNHINGEGAWQANPWVVAYTFQVTLQNIDQIGRESP